MTSARSQHSSSQPEFQFDACWPLVTGPDIQAPFIIKHGETSGVESGARHLLKPIETADVRLPPPCHLRRGVTSALFAHANAPRSFLTNPSPHPRAASPRRNNNTPSPSAPPPPRRSLAPHQPPPSLFFIDPSAPNPAVEGGHSARASDLRVPDWPLLILACQLRRIGIGLEPRLLHHWTTTTATRCLPLPHRSVLLPCRKPGMSIRCPSSALAYTRMLALTPSTRPHHRLSLMRHRTHNNKANNTATRNGPHWRVSAYCPKPQRNRPYRVTTPPTTCPS